MKDFTKNVYIIKNVFKYTNVDLENMINKKLSRSFEVYQKNVDKNIHYLLYCRSPEKVKKYLDKKYKVMKGENNDK